MNPKRNILFIMCDQLRRDYLSCYGHTSLATPNIDGLAARGVRFANAYCQAPLCAPSRASFYTGRYQSNHGVMSNDDALQLGEKTLSDYLRPLGYRSAVAGKTHCHKSKADMQACGIDLHSAYAAAAASGGFEPYEWHEGLYPDSLLPEDQGYTRYLQSVGFDEQNPWSRRSNTSVDKNGKLHSGWALRSSAYPACVPEEHSETAFITRRAMDFIEQTGDRPWCLHLSYIKPHWPIIAPAPYHDMFGPADVQNVVRGERERTNPHPVVNAFMRAEYSKSFSRSEVRDAVIPAYMGLVKQIDDHIGRLITFLESRELLQNTMIVFTADHGDYLGDHWLGEKDLFHAPSSAIPLIVCDPDVDADGTRGTVREELIESLDIVPTFVEFAGGEACRERVEGRSLLPLLRSDAPLENWREYAISEIDYSDREVRQILDIEPYRCRATMVCHEHWKFVYYLGFAPQLFDLENDPDELNDLGLDPKLDAVREHMKEIIFDWQYSLKRRVGLAYECAEAQGPQRDEQHGIVIGRW